MNIERLGPVEPISKLNKNSKTQKPEKAEQKDSVNISSDAKTMGEVYKVAEQVKAGSDIRWDRVEQVKKNLEDPNYIDNKVVESVADSIIDLFGIE
ncbi:MAG: flagellar biosynthesis anti-sigma factor FlgM [Spirochaetaceae bacterium]